MGKPRRPRSRPAGTPQPFQPASAEIRAADALIAADDAAPATDRPVEAAAPPAEAVQAPFAATEAVWPDAASGAESEETPEESSEDSSEDSCEETCEPAAEAAAETVSQAESRAEVAVAIALPPVPAVGAEIAAAAAPNRILFTPDRLDVVAIGSIIARYVRGEGEAALAHLRALSGARSPADVIRLQVGEVQRAADASLTCWVAVVGQASRVVAPR